VKNAIFWDVTLCDYCKNRVYEEPSASIIRVTRIGELGPTLAITSSLNISLQLLRVVTANVVHSSTILVTLIMDALGYSETSVLTRATRRNIPGDGILHSHGRENLKSYIDLMSYTCDSQLSS
jgi:hypothetical protein